jgi:tetratricopeptide (TPR) repeat protein
MKKALFLCLLFCWPIVGYGEEPKKDSSKNPEPICKEIPQIRDEPNRLEEEKNTPQNLLPEQQKINEYFGKSQQQELRQVLFDAERYEAEGKFSSAKEMWEKYLNIRRSVFGSSSWFSREEKIVREHCSRLDSLTTTDVKILADCEKVIDEVGSLFQSDNPKEATKLIYDAIENSKNIWGENDIEHVGYLRTTFLWFEFFGKYREANDVAEKANDITRNTLGDKHPYYASALSSQAKVKAYFYLEYDSAYKLYEEAYRIMSDAIGENDPVCIDWLVIMGNIQRRNMNFASAQGNLEKAMKAYRTLSETDEKLHARILLGFGDLYADQGYYSKSFNIYSEIKDIFRNHDESLLELCVALSGEASALSWSGENSKAEEVISEGLLANAFSPIPNHVALKGSYYNLAEINCEKKNYTRALEYANQTIKYAERTGGESSPIYAGAIKLRGEVHLKMGRFPDAEADFSKALNLLDTEAKKKSSLCIYLTADIGQLFLKTNKYDEAEIKLLQAKKELLAVLPKNHLKNGEVTGYLAELYLNKKEFPKAEQFALESLDIYEKPLGDRDPQAIAGALEMYLKVLQATSQDAKAKEIEAKLNQVRTEKRQLVSS